MARDRTRARTRRSLEHLYDELRRVELLVRAQVERWRRAVGEQRVDTEWGTGILDPPRARRASSATTSSSRSTSRTPRTPCRSTSLRSLASRWRRSGAP